VRPPFSDPPGQRLAPQEPKVADSPLEGAGFELPVRGRARGASVDHLPSFSPPLRGGEAVVTGTLDWDASADARRRYDNSAAVADSTGTPFGCAAARRSARACRPPVARSDWLRCARKQYEDMIAPFIEETLGAIPYRARVGGPDLLVISHVLSSSKERIAGPHIAVTPVVWVRAFARRRGKNDSPLEREVPKVCRLFAGGEWIRTSSTRKQ
jgi:hypothetical protein